jgi:hypothetical protein
MSLDNDWMVGGGTGSRARNPAPTACPGYQVHTKGWRCRTEELVASQGRANGSRERGQEDLHERRLMVPDAGGGDAAAGARAAGPSSQGRLAG